MIRTVFMGTAPIALPSLRALKRLEFVELVAVVTQPDRPKGRELKPTPSAVKDLALSEGWTVLQPERARDPEFFLRMQDLRPDLVVVMAYGQIIPANLLTLPKYGCLNLHTSLLPRHRGAAPIQWAILEGDDTTGITLMFMEAGLDTGPTIAKAETPIGASDDAITLHDRLAELAAALLERSLPDYLEGRLPLIPQDSSRATYARKIEKEDGRIRWEDSAVSIWNRVRAFSPWPGAFTTVPLGAGEVSIKIWKAEPVQVQGQGGARPGEVVAVGPGVLGIACGEGVLAVNEVQKEGGRRMAVRDFLAGHRIEPGQICGKR